MKSFFLILTFLTRIPVKIRGDFSSEDFTRGIKYMPLVGLIIGSIMLGIYFVMAKVDLLVASLVTWLCYIWLTGGLHIDGLADTFDGIFSNRDRERIFEIMKDSRIGAFGVIGIFMVFFTDIIIGSKVSMLGILFAPFVARACAIVSCAFSSYAKKSGMGKDFVDYLNLKHAIFAIAEPIVFALIIGFIMKDLGEIYPLLIATFLAFIVNIGLIDWFKKKLGGMTGDTIGFTVEIMQAVYLFLLCVLEAVV